MARASPRALEVGLARMSRQVLMSKATCAPQARQLSALPPLLAAATRLGLQRASTVMERALLMTVKVVAMRLPMTPTTLATQHVSTAMPLMAPAVMTQPTTPHSRVQRVRTATRPTAPWMPQLPLSMRPASATSERALLPSRDGPGAASPGSKPVTLHARRQRPLPASHAAPAAPNHAVAGVALRPVPPTAEQPSPPLPHSPAAPAPRPSALDHAPPSPRSTSDNGCRATPPARARRAQHFLPTRTPPPAVRRRAPGRSTPFAAGRPADSPATAPAHHHDRATTDPTAAMHLRDCCAHFPAAPVASVRQARAARTDAGPRSAHSHAPHLTHWPRSTPSRTAPPAAPTHPPATRSPASQPVPAPAQHRSTCTAARAPALPPHAR